MASILPDCYQIKVRIKGAGVTPLVLEGEMCSQQPQDDEQFLFQTQH